MTHTVECTECEGSGIIVSRFSMSAYVGPQTMAPPDYDQFNCEYCNGNGSREVDSEEVSA